MKDPGPDSIWNMPTFFSWDYLWFCEKKFFPLKDNVQEMLGQNYTKLTQRESKILEKATQAVTEAKERFFELMPESVVRFKW